MNDSSSPSISNAHPSRANNWAAEHDSYNLNETWDGNPATPETKESRKGITNELQDLHVHTKPRTWVAERDDYNLNAAWDGDQAVAPAREVAEASMAAKPAAVKVQHGIRAGNWVSGHDAFNLNEAWDEAQEVDKAAENARVTTPHDLHSHSHSRPGNYVAEHDAYNLNEVWGGGQVA